MFCKYFFVSMINHFLESSVLTFLFLLKDQREAPTYFVLSVATVRDQSVTLGGHR